MLSEICKELNNWFAQKILFGVFTIENGDIDLSDFLIDGQYFRIVGSVLNDGVYKYPIENSYLSDETFRGAVWAMSVPRDVLALNDEIEAWQAKYGDVSTNPYQSESFGGYSYSKASGGSGATWQSAFASKLKKWRKL